MRKISLYIILLLSFLFLISSGCGGGGGGGVTPSADVPNAPSDTVEVTGRVLEEVNGTLVPLSGAYLILTSSSSSASITSSIIFETYSDSNGYYSFSNVPSGSGNISVWRDKNSYDSAPSQPLTSINVVAGEEISDIVVNNSSPGATPQPGDTGTPVPAPVPGITAIRGVVVSSDGGPPVVSANVTLVETGQTALTDSNGFFSFEVSPDRTYTVLVTRENYASSKAQTVRVTSGSATTLELIEMPLFSPGWSADTPSITVTGVANDEVISDYVYINVSVQSENPMRTIILRVGNKHGVYDMYEDNSSELEYILFASEIPPGGTYIYLSAYDMNNNRSEITINIKGTSFPIEVPSSAPSDLRAYSYTVGETLQVYSARVERLKEEGNISPDFDPYIIKLPDGETGDLRNVPPESSCYTVVRWTAVDGAEGYKIYRATDASGPYTFIAHSLLGSWTTYYDSEPSYVSPGQTLYYRVSPYNSAGEGPASTSPPVTVLDVFRINLSQPAHNSVTSTRSPVLSWTISGNDIGTYRKYGAVIWNYTGGSSALSVIPLSSNSPLSNQTSVNAGSLAGGTVYEWNVYGVAMGSYSNFGYLSYSYPTFDDRYTVDTIPCYSSNNGRFMFTTP